MLLPEALRGPAHALTPTEGDLVMNRNSSLLTLDRLRLAMSRNETAKRRMTTSGDEGATPLQTGPQREVPELR